MKLPDKWITRNTGKIKEVMKLLEENTYIKWGSGVSPSEFVPEFTSFYGTYWRNENLWHGSELKDSKDQKYEYNSVELTEDQIIDLLSPVSEDNIDKHIENLNFLD